MHSHMASLCTATVLLWVFCLQCIPSLRVPAHVSVAAAAKASQAKKLKSAQQTSTLRASQSLLQDNLQPTLDAWQRIRSKNGGQKFTMQHFFKTAAKAMERHRRHVAFFGIRNNRVFQLDKDGDLRYSVQAMRDEAIPNAGVASSLKASLWLAIEDAAATHGISLPDVIFVYHFGDGPLCDAFKQGALNCSNGSFAPPLSIMGFRPDKLPAASLDSHGDSLYPDLLLPLFRFLGYSKYGSVDDIPHHPAVGLSRMRSASNRIVPDTAWEQKISKLYFRGSGHCPSRTPHGASMGVCPRAHLTELSVQHFDKLDIYDGMHDIPKEVKKHNRGAGEFSAMRDWSKFKYLACLDGLGESSRLLSLLYSGSTVVMQQSSPFYEWYYHSLKPGVHYEEVFKEVPGAATTNQDDALELVDHLRADDGYARTLASNALDFARKYLNLPVTMHYLRGVLLAYRDLFEDMHEYMQHTGDTGTSEHFFSEIKLASS